MQPNEYSKISFLLVKHQLQNYLLQCNIREVNRP